MWDLPGSGMEPVSPALTGGFLITREAGRRRNVIEGTETAARPLGIYHIIKPGLWNRTNVLYISLSLSFFLPNEIKGPRPPPVPPRQGWQRTRGADPYSLTFRRPSALPLASPLSASQRLGVAPGRDWRGRGAEAQRSREGRPLPLALPPAWSCRWTRGLGLG